MIGFSSNQQLINQSKTIKGLGITRPLDIGLKDLVDVNVIGVNLIFSTAPI
ncbi:hypothetical protein JM83_3740 [Gillisia sp. Hel_I_86]|nr:hypothetical protein JM83_3740 [Gillisia sp. Hel_I_86]